LKAVQKRLKRLIETADEIEHLGLTGQYIGLYKLRVYGKYRVIYDWQRDKELIVVRVGKRSDVYRE
jgi:mRNA-degrading endonuclease RelE of RelBE toxin-antitoxin system